jgi:hypothetical protein
MAHRLVTTARLAALLLTIGAATAEAQETLPEDLLITLERTPCFGSCPSYSVTIDAAGTVTYKGFKYVRVEGRQSDRIPVSRVAALWAAAKRIGFFEMRDSYRAPITDHPTTFVSIRGAGRSKRIEDYVAGPDDLKQFERLIEETARTKRWVSLDEGMLQQLIRDGWSPSENERSERLQKALVEDDLSVVNGLLAIGADPNRPWNGSLPLMSVQSEAAARALLAAGANPFNPASYGNPLSRAATLRPGVAEQFIKAGVPVDQRFDSDGRTALWTAACSGNAGVVALLLKAGADPGIHVRGISAVKCAQQTRDLAPRPRWMPPSPFIADFDGVIALLEQATAKRKEPPAL